MNLRTRLPAGLMCAAVLTAVLAGCAAPPRPGGGIEPIPAFRDAGMTVQQARDATAIGLTKAEVASRLGPAAEVKFASGYEVWAYRMAAPPASRDAARPDDREPDRPEFIVLFSPDGVVSKTRLR